VKKVDFNKTATEGFSIQSAIKRSILKQHNLNTTQTSGAASQNKTERSANNSIGRPQGEPSISQLQQSQMKSINKGKVINTQDGHGTPKPPKGSQTTKTNINNKLGTKDFIPKQANLLNNSIKIDSYGDKNSLL
jgi:hypothetical protein